MPSKRGGGSEAEVRGDGSTSLELHAREEEIVPLKNLNKESPVTENSTKNHINMGGNYRSRISTARADRDSIPFCRLVLLSAHLTGKPDAMATVRVREEAELRARRW